VKSKKVVRRKEVWKAVKGKGNRDTDKLASIFPRENFGISKVGEKQREGGDTNQIKKAMKGGNEGRKGGLALLSSPSNAGESKCTLTPGGGDSGEKKRSVVAGKGKV